MGTKEAVEYLDKNRNRMDGKTVTIGMDGFVDKILIPIKVTEENNKLVFFSGIDEFGKYIASNAGMSCGIRVNEKFTKLGGNAPIMANAISCAGLKVNCMGALGYPEIKDIFKQNMDKNCNLYSVSEPGYTTALEFDDGKVMLGQYDYLQNMSWDSFKNILGLETIKRFFDESVLVGLVHFAAITMFNEITQGMIDEIVKKIGVDKNKMIFFDTADLSKRGRNDILKLTDIIKQFNSYRKVIVGLNASEAIMFYRAVFGDTDTDDIKIIGDKLYGALECDILVIHTLLDALAWQNSEFVKVPSLYVRKPKLSTGGGDNFNAGLCFGFIMGMDLENSLYTANAVSGSYVRNAHSPSYETILQTLRDWDKLIETPIN